MNLITLVVYLHSYIDFFSGYVNEEQEERFHQAIEDMGKRYQGRWNVNMMADYYFMLERECSTEGRK